MSVMQLMSRTRSAMRKAAAILAATQIMVVATPLTESASGNAVAHVESSGVQSHHAHNEEFCIACVALKMFDSAAHAAALSFPSSDASAAAIAASDISNLRLANGPPRSRAPPSSLVG